MGLEDHSVGQEDLAMGLEDLVVGQEDRVAMGRGALCPALFAPLGAIGAS